MAKLDSEMFQFGLFISSLFPITMVIPVMISSNKGNIIVIVVICNNSTNNDIDNYGIIFVMLIAKFRGNLGGMGVRGSMGRVAGAPLFRTWAWVLGG